MDITRELLEEAGFKTISSGSRCLVTLSDAAKLLDLAFEHRLGIVGIEGFLVSGQSLIPDMNAIADFSELLNAKDALDETHRQARLFIQALKNPDTYLEFVF